MTNGCVAHSNVDIEILLLLLKKCPAAFSHFSQMAAGHFVSDRMDSTRD